MLNLRTLLASSFALVAACAADSPSGTEMEPDGPAGTLAVQAPAGSTRVIRNQTVEVALELARNEGIAGNVDITVEGLPAGVTAEPLSLADGETTALLKLSAGDQIALGTELTVTVRATHGEVSATSLVTIRLTDAPGARDISFGPNGERIMSYTPGHSEYATAIAMQNDGKVLVAGVDSNVKVLLVARYLENGELDPDFGDKGIASVVIGNVATYGVHGITMRPDGVILVAMHLNENGLVYAMKADGSAYADYGTGGAMQLSPLNSGGTFKLALMAARPDGSMVVAGHRNGDVVITRLTPDGDFDSQFDHGGVKQFDLGGDDMITSLTIDAQGRPLIAGAFVDANGQKFGIARLAEDGQLDMDFAGDGTADYPLFPHGQFTHARTLPDGRILAFGYTDDGASPMMFLDSAGGFDYQGVVPVMSYVPVSSVVLDDGFVGIGYSTAGSFRGVVSKHEMTGATSESFGDKGLSGTAPSMAFRDSLDGVVDEKGRLWVVGNQSESNDLDFVITRIWL